MPVQWTISKPHRLVIAVARDELRLEDVENYLDGVTVANALTFRKIFDMTHAVVMLSDADMMALGARIRAYLKVSKLGPLAIVAVTERAYEQASLFQVLAEGDRPVKIFRELHLAREWLDAFDSGS
ncbi:MAG: hypothetical protein EPO10_02855 [Reyranella sp.]|uniref:hypothetical protein n=1 Tax=Reyranella sp. TaxID=1929291 RepID=UPI00121C681D|nr:hypothetical protein [Reyranella sp.]TAJ95628.1 MAG: hypothetical protein EPO41_10395 [Reyranella sp.]TBR30431.1 MAG: hypothetical protein EPO10_02855 [Reyranella sp.]